MGDSLTRNLDRIDRRDIRTAVRYLADSRHEATGALGELRRSMRAEAEATLLRFGISPDTTPTPMELFQYVTTLQDLQERARRSSVDAAELIDDIEKLENLLEVFGVDVYRIPSKREMNDILDRMQLLETRFQQNSQAMSAMEEDISQMELRLSAATGRKYYLISTAIKRLADTIAEYERQIERIESETIELEDVLMSSYLDSHFHQLDPQITQEAQRRVHFGQPNVAYYTPEAIPSRNLSRPKHSDEEEMRLHAEEMNRAYRRSESEPRWLNGGCRFIPY